MFFLEAICQSKETPRESRWTDFIKFLIIINMIVFLKDNYMKKEVLAILKIKVVKEKKGKSYQMINQ